MLETLTLVIYPATLRGVHLYCKRNAVTSVVGARVREPAHRYDNRATRKLLLWAFDHKHIPEFLFTAQLGLRDTTVFRIGPTCKCSVLQFHTLTHTVVLVWTRDGCVAETARQHTRTQVSEWPQGYAFYHSATVQWPHV